MRVDVPEMTKEAVKRMMLLNIDDNNIKNFMRHDIVYIHEPPDYIEEPDDDEYYMIKEAEENGEIKVYAIIRSYTVFGPQLACLFVSNSNANWASELQLSDNEIRSVALIINTNDDDVYYSFISVRKTDNNSLIRII